MPRAPVSLDIIPSFGSRRPGLLDSTIRSRSGESRRGRSGFSFEFFSHGSDPRYPVNQVSIRGVEILDERSLRSSGKDREYVRFVTGRCYGRVIAGGEGKSVPVAGHISRCVPVRTVPELGAEAGRGIEAPVIQFLVCGLSWQIGIVLVRRIARPATFIRVELANE